MIVGKKNVALNLGSGPNSAPGWINYDWGLLPLMAKFGMTKWLDGSYNTPWVKIELRNLKYGLKEKAGEVDYIYCSHVLEHFEKLEALGILRECLRVLKPGGRLRVVLPDLEKVKKIQDPDQFNRTFFGFNKDQFWGWKNRIKVWFIRPHQWMYTPQSFSKILRDAGFRKIELKTFRVGYLPDLEVLDLDIHRALSFYVEAQK